MRAGSKHYHCALGGEGLLEKRLGPQRIDAHPYGEPFVLGDVQISFHPAGHVLGSAQIRIDDGDAVWVITGDYKRDPDPTCQRFEPIHCDVLITEATFALPIYRWPSMDPSDGTHVSLVGPSHSKSKNPRSAVLFAW